MRRVPSAFFSGQLKIFMLLKCAPTRFNFSSKSAYMHPSRFIMQSDGCREVSTKSVRDERQQHILNTGLPLRTSTLQTFLGTGAPRPLHRWRFPGFVVQVVVPGGHT